MRLIDYSRFRGTVLAAAFAALPVLPAGAQPTPVTLELQDLTGAGRSLEELRGEIVVVNFWATWCLPCLRELPLLDRLAHDYERAGVRFVAVSTDDESTRAAIPDAVEAAGVGFEVWQGATTLDMQRFRVGTALPATAILDRDGTIAHRFEGEVGEAALRAQLDALIAAPERHASAPTGADAPQPAQEDEAGAAIDEHHDGDVSVQDVRGEHDHDAHDRGHDHGDEHDHDMVTGDVADASLVPS